ncbi:MAG TPA: Crp/Fnr family transcriptional regulator [Sphingobacteriaceae bacterium]|nr:Crp/Fnr family transcriptional regulator [Sphingobacteriaceae bacterium]
MHEYLYQKIKENISITDEEFEFVKTLFLPKKLRKKHFILEEGDICKYNIFVEKGILRTYKIDEKGNEHTLQFAFEGWWAADLYSFFTNEPSSFYIEALENCELLLISKQSWDDLLDKVPSFERYFRILLQNNLISMQRRLMRSLSETAEEKYLNLAATFPDLLQRVPQTIIASYLGITPETLSRIRGQLALRR